MIKGSGILIAKSKMEQRDWKGGKKQEKLKYQGKDKTLVEKGTS